MRPRNARIAGPSRLALAALALAATATGCVERRFTVRTNPPGALVYVNGQELGPSPVSMSYTYYKPREIVLVADGFQTFKTVERFDAPMYDNLLTEFFTENLVPWTIRDERELFYEMKPAEDPQLPQLVGRAEQLRGQASQPPPERPRGLFDRLFNRDRQAP